MASCRKDLRELRTNHVLPGAGAGMLFVSFVCLMEQEQATTRELPPLTKRALGLAKVSVPDDWDYKNVLADELTAKYGVQP